VVLAGLAIALQASLILTVGHDARSVSYCTVTAICFLTVGLTVAEVGRAIRFRDRLETAAVAAIDELERLRDSIRARVGALVAFIRQPVSLVIGGACAAGVAIRFIIPRGLWLDEATSVYQARMGPAEGW
jgi:hypothetical protein